MADQAIQWVKKQINAFELALHKPERRPALMHKCNRAALVLVVLAILLGAPLRYFIAPVLIVLLAALFLLGQFKCPADQCPMVLSDQRGAKRLKQGTVPVKQDLPPEAVSPLHILRPIHLPASAASAISR